MSVNKHRPHLYIIPEDDDNRELANGFVNYDSVHDNRVQVRPVARGWKAVLNLFQNDYVSRLRKFQEGHVVLLVDFDEKVDSRRQKFVDTIPVDLRERVFVLGVLDEPQDLKNALNNQYSYEEIGCALAADCHNNTTDMWDHDHLKHNEAERKRLMNAVKKFLF